MAAPSAAAVTVSKSPDAVPESEERVYLYQKSGAESLVELEAKRRRYVDLDGSLVSLPQKLRHPGLIPLGPGLFGHGELVRTNEIMVLLGDSYFAEMSAHEARAVVRRRIALIDEKIAAVEVGQAEVDEILAKEPKEDKIRTLSKKQKKHPGFKKGFLNTPDVEEKFVSGNKPPKSPRPGSSSPSKRRVSFSDDTKGGEYESAESGDSGNSDRSASAMVKELLKNFKGSVALAEEQLGQDQTVNFEEVYDKDGNLVEVRGIDNSDINNPEEPNSVSGIGDTCDTEDDRVLVELVPEVESDTSESEASEGGTTGVNGGGEKILTRADYFDALLECEMEEEENERREEEAKEAETFGSGLKRGFLDAAHKEEEKVANAGDNGDEATTNGRIPVENTVKERTGRRRRGRRVGGTQVEGVKVFSLQQETEAGGEKKMSRFKQSRLKNQ